MTNPPTLLPRDCFDGAEVRRKFGSLDEHGNLKIRSRQWLESQRKQRAIPFIKFGARNIMYPRAAVMAILSEANVHKLEQLK